MTENNNKIIIIAILIIILGIIIWFVFKPKKTPDQNDNTAMQEKTEITYSENSDQKEEPQDYQEYKIDKYNIIFSYPKNWEATDIEIKDVTAPLTKQELASIFDPSNKDENKISASGELLRFIMEKDIDIKSKDDWYNYVKGKIDSLLDDKEMLTQTNYQFISLEKVDDIDGSWAVREDYTHKSGIRGRDYYIFNEDIYQFVFECRENLFTTYQPIFDKIANSFKLK